MAPRRREPTSRATTLRRTDNINAGTIADDADDPFVSSICYAGRHPVVAYWAAESFNPGSKRMSTMDLLSGQLRPLRQVQMNCRSPLRLEDSPGF
jgi:hypothetical protein